MHGENLKFQVLLLYIASAPNINLNQVLPTNIFFYYSWNIRNYA